MRESSDTEAQMAMRLRRAGTPVAEVCQHEQGAGPCFWPLPWRPHSIFR
jgi:hypothetical protein